MKDTVLYWHGILNNGIEADLEKNIQKVLDKLRAGNYKSADLEKLCGHSVYSVRLNKENRLLFATVVINGEPYLLLLDVVLNHDYAKSKFLKPKVLARFMDANISVLQENIQRGDFEPFHSNIPNLVLDENVAIKLRRAEFFNQKFIVLNEHQNDAILSSTPLLINGAPGSGKSTLGVILLRQAAENLLLQGIVNPRLVFVASSEELVKTIQKIWEEQPDIPSCTVDFKTYNDLLTDSNCHLTKNNIADKAFFDSWIKNRVKKERQKLKASKSKPDENLLSRTHEMYKEFRIISGCKNESEYQSMGVDQTLFAKADQRTWLYNSYQAYLKNGKIDPAFMPLNLKVPYQFMVIDESPDFARLQLINLIASVENQNYVINMDNHQSIKDDNFSHSFLESYSLKIHNKKLKIINLPLSCRCPEQVIFLANGVIDLKRAILGGLGDKKELLSILPQINAKEGEARWIKKADLERNLDELKHMAKRADFAVVTQKKFVDELKLLLNTKSVFTVENIKGLEFNKILAWRLFETSSISNAGKRISCLSNIEKNTNLPKHKAEIIDDSHKAFNKIFTAITRAMETLYLYDEPNDMQAVIVNYLSRLTLKKSQDISYEYLPESTTEDWEKLCRVLAGTNNMIQAKDIYEERIRKIRQVNFDDWLNPKPDNSPNIIDLSISKPPLPIPTSALGKNKQPPLKNNRRKNDNKKSQAPEYIQQSRNEQIVCDLSKRSSKKAVKMLFDLNNPLTLLFKTKVSRKAEIGYSFISGKSSYEKLNVGCLFSLWSFDPDIWKTLLQTLKSKKIQIGWDVLCYQISEDLPPPIFFLIVNPQGIPFLKSMLSKPVNINLLAKTINFDFKINMMMIFLQDSNSHDLLLKLLTLYPSLSKEINPSIIMAELGECEQSSVFNKLCLTKKGQNILEILFRENPELGKYVTAEHLCTKKPCSALYWLSAADSEKMLVLDRIFASNPLLIKQISIEALTDVRNVFNDSALFWLSLPSRCFLLQKILLENPHFYDEITESHLCASYDFYINRKCHSDYIYLRLNSSEIGRDLLSRFKNFSVEYKQLIENSLNLNESYSETAITPSISNFKHINQDSKMEVIKKIIKDGNQSGYFENLEVIYFIYPEKIHPFYIDILNLEGGIDFIAKLIEKPVLNPRFIGQALSFSDGFGLFCFVCKEKGLETILNLFTRNPQIIENLNANILTGFTSESNQSPLDLLIQSSMGIKLLDILLENNHSFYNELGNPKILYTTGIFNNLTRLMWGEKVLKRLFDNDPDLIKKMPRNLFVGNNSQAIFNLLSTKDKQDFLFDILPSRPEFYQQISVELLFKKISLNQSIFYRLATLEEGCNILNRIFNENTKIMSQITADILFSIQNEKEESAFSLFLTRSQLLRISESILRNNIDLIKAMTADILYGYYQQQPVLYWCAGRGAKTLLKGLVRHNPTLLQKITFEQLTNIDADNTNTLYWLSQTQEGIEAISVIFENEALLNQMSSEILIRQSMGYRLNIFHVLSFTEKGCNVLCRLMEKKPDLANIPDDLLSQHGKNGKSSIFTNLLKRDSGMKVLSQILTVSPSSLKNTQVFELCNKDNISLSDMLSFLTHSTSSSLLQQLIKLKVNFLGILTREILYSIQPDTGDSIAYRLTMNSINTTVLKEWLEANPQLAILEPGQLCAKQAYGHSLLTRLASTQQGLTVLNHLIQANQFLSKEPTLETVLEKNLSGLPLYFLLTQNELSDFFNSIMKNNVFYKGMSDELFNASRYNGASALILLSYTSVGVNYLDELFSRYPALYHLDPELTYSKSFEFFKTIFSNIPLKSNCSWFLAKWLEHCPELMNQIPFEVFTTLDLNNKSLLYYWSLLTIEEESGFSFLNKHIKNFALKLSPEIMHKTPENMGSILFNLLEMKQIQLVDEILSKNLILLNSIDSTQLHRMFSGIEITIFLQLLRVRGGYIILNRIFENNPTLLQEIPLETNFRGDSLFHCLVYKIENLTVFRKFESSNSDYLTSLNVNILSIKYVGNEMTPLSCLILHQEGRQILLDILTKNPEFCQGISSEAFYDVLSKIECSVFDKLCQTEQGRQLIKFLFQHNENLKNSKPVVQKSGISNRFFDLKNSENQEPVSSRQPEFLP